MNDLIHPNADTLTVRSLFVISSAFRRATVL